MLGNNIAKLRKEKELSQEQLADILNTSRQAVSKWERGDAYPDIDRLKDLAILFNVSIDYLLDYDMASSSISSFMERLNTESKDKSFTITVVEIKSILSKNTNNFNLLISVINYLFNYWQKYRDNDLVDLLLSYCKKAISIYKKNNTYNVSINDIKQLIILMYFTKKDYEAAKEYIKDSDYDGKENMLADCEIRLGNYESADKILSESFLNSISSLIVSNISQLRLYLRTNKIKEANDFAAWSISLIKSISNNENSIITLLYVITFLKACAEKYLKYDCTDSLNFLKNEYDNIKNFNNSVDFESKFYNQKIEFYLIDSSMEEALYREIEDSKGCLMYDVLKETYEEIFGRK